MSIGPCLTSPVAPPVQRCQPSSVVSSRDPELKERVRRPIVVETIFAKGDLAGPLAREDFLALVVVSLIYVTIALLIVTSQRRNQRRESARDKMSLLNTPRGVRSRRPSAAQRKREAAETSDSREAAIGRHTKREAMNHPRPIALVALLVVILVVLIATPAQAHGPCGCLTPRRGSTATRVSIPRSMVMKIVWNPRPVTFPTGSLMKRHARRSYEAQEKTLTLYERPRARSGGAFEVPMVRPGRYMVQIFDGTEGGGHYTWGFFTVASPSSLPRTGVTGSYWLAAVLIVLGVVLIVVANLGPPRPCDRTRSRR